MIFALAAALLTALAVAAVLIPVLRRHRQGPSRADYDLTVYRDQLRELESDRARGLVSEEQEEAARTEIERRMLRAARAREVAQTTEAAQAAEPRDTTARAGRRHGGGGRRRWDSASASRPLPPASMRASAPPGCRVAPSPRSSGRSRSRQQLRPFASRSSASRRGCRAIPAISKAGSCSAAPTWFCSAIQRRPTRYDRRLRFPAAIPMCLGMLGEAIVWANDGVVVPEAVRVFRQALETQPDDPVSRFHLALARAQAGEVQEAYEIWLALAADTPADAAWRGDLEGLIRQAAEVLGVEPGLAPSAPAVAEAPSGPTADDVAAAAEMSPDERTEMIRGMVEGLAARLEENPDDPQGWRRLARSYAVLGEPEKALDTLRRAVEFAPDDLATLHAYARALTGDIGANPQPPAAVAVYERILALDPADGAALWFVGLAAAERGDADAARIHWERLLPLLAPGTEEHEAVRTALDTL